MLFCAVVYGAGCEESNLERYHAKEIGGENMINEDFLYKKENMIDCAYKNRDYDPNDPSSRKYIYDYDSTYPPYRLIRVTDQMLNDKVFEKIPEFNLETEMVFIVLFSVSGSYRYGLKNIVFNDNVLKVIIKVERFGLTTNPELVSLIIQLDKLDYTESELILTKH